MWVVGIGVVEFEVMGWYDFRLDGIYFNDFGYEKMVSIFLWVIIGFGESGFFFLLRDLEYVEDMVEIYGDDFDIFIVEV